MQPEPNPMKEVSALLELYNQEIDKLKSRLLNGASWEELAVVRRNIIELAISIHKSHHYIVPDFFDAELAVQKQI